MRRPLGTGQPAIRFQTRLVRHHQSIADYLHRANRNRCQATINEFSEDWGERYPVVIRLWNNAWEQFTSFLAYPPEIRRVVYTTNMIESLNARFRQATRRRGHFPNDQAALRVLYLVVRDRRKPETTSRAKP